MQTLADPPAPPALTAVTLIGFAVVRDDDGRPRALQQAGTPRDDIPSARYAVIHDNFDDACLEAKEQLIQALAGHTYRGDARHIVPIVVRKLVMRDFRPIPIRQDALDVALDHLASGKGDEPWWDLAIDSEGGLILPLRSASPEDGGCFLLVVDRLMHCVELEDPLERISLDDLSA